MRFLDSLEVPHSICYMDANSVMVERLRTQAREADRLHERSRQMLAEAVRAGARAGLTQQQIAQAVGRSQPEVSRLLKFHGSTTLGLALRKKRLEIIAVAATYGATNIRVFGSMVKGVDPSDAGIDLLVSREVGASKGALEELEQELSSLVGADIHVLSDASLGRNPNDRVLSEAVAL